MRATLSAFTVLVFLFAGCNPDFVTTSLSHQPKVEKSSTMLHMITLPANATDDEILDVVRQWVDLLANGEYVQAQSMLIRDGAERVWPPQLVAEVIGSYEIPQAWASLVTNRESRRCAMRGLLTFNRGRAFSDGTPANDLE